jgi:hypothetical protein
MRPINRVAMSAVSVELCRSLKKGVLIRGLEVEKQKM